MSAVTLRLLCADDAPAMHEVMVRDRDRLTRLGDWDIPPSFSVSDVLADIEQPPHGKVAYGIWHNGRLVGQISLTLARPPHWAIGYFLDDRATGRGIATAACRVLAEEAARRGAVDLYAVVTHGNDKSCGVLRRAGFKKIEHLTHSSRWWLPLTDPPIME